MLHVDREVSVSCWNNNGVWPVGLKMNEKISHFCAWEVDVVTHLLFCGKDSLIFVIYFWNFLSRVISWLCNGQTFFCTVWVVELVKALIAKLGGNLFFFNDLGLLGRCHFWVLENWTQLTVNLSCGLSYLKNRLHQSWFAGFGQHRFLVILVSDALFTDSF